MYCDHAPTTSSNIILVNEYNVFGLMTYMKIRILVRNSNVKGSVVVMTYLDGNSIPKKKRFG